MIDGVRNARQRPVEGRGAGRAPNLLLLPGDILFVPESVVPESNSILNHSALNCILTPNPLVTNTRSELIEAFEDYQAGRLA